MLIVLDTNVLPRQGKVETVMISTILRVASALGARVSITETVLHESVNARMEEATRAVDQHPQALAKLSRLSHVQPYYVPSVEQIVSSWREQLLAAFEILELHGDDAREALQREASRRKPAKVGGTGARDAAIWLCVKREHSVDPTTTHFVSANTEDFAASRSNRQLHPDLQTEVANSNGEFVYHVSLDSLLAAIGAPAPLVLSAEFCSTEILLSVVEQIIGHEELRKFPDFASRAPEEFGPIEGIELYDVMVKSSYFAAERIVAFVVARFTMRLAEEVRETLGSSVVGRIGGWVELPANGSGTVERFDVTFIGEIGYS